MPGTSRPDKDRPSSHAPQEAGGGPADTRASDSGVDSNWSTLFSQPASAPPAPPAIPGYEILSEIYRGGQGVVYLAFQASTHRRVALKVMGGGPLASEAERARFRLEVQTLASLRHPNIVSIHDSGVAGECHYFVMDYVEGQSLDEWSATRWSPRANDPACASSARDSVRNAVRPILELFARVCDAVQAAHARGIVHRDLKPRNIRVDDAGEPRILDFGLAKIAHPAGGEAAMTITGQFVGSLPWASPEQAEGSPSMIDARSDVYSLGVTLYQLLTGRFPYDVNGGVRAVLERITGAEPVRPRGIVPALDDEVETIVLACLRKEPQRRYQTAGEVAAEIRRYLRGESLLAKRDSFRRRFRKGFGRAVRRHPFVTWLTAALAAGGIARLVATPLVFEWTPANRLVEVGLTTLAAAPARARPLEHVRVVGRTDATRVDELASAAGLVDVSAAEIRSLRRLHGRLMERLADAGARAVVWDISFEGESPFDADFVRGVTALQQRGVDVTVAISNWLVASGGQPALSPVIAPHVRWGSNVANFTSQSAWKVVLFMQRGQSDPQPSLALCGLASARQPGAGFVMDFHAGSERLTMRYWRSGGGGPAGARSWLDQFNEVQLVSWEVRDSDAPAVSLRRGDVLGYYLLNMPSDATLAAATTEYGRAISATIEELRAELGGKVVVVGDMRSAIDPHPHPRGRQIAGCLGHAVAIEQLLREASFRRPSSVERVAIVLAAGMVGALVGARRPAAGRRLTANGTLMLAGAVACVLAATQCWYLCNPLVPLAALLLGGELMAFMKRVDPLPHLTSSGVPS
ncbi:MAG: Serine/threonine-protein kinase PknD [Phycisphaerae bacterium]|nr:Serine/threonine-protein kinase PknD [Phycisphaerae bacterium]